MQTADTSLDMTAQVSRKPTLTKGRFQPVYWQPLGARGDRITVAVLIETGDVVSVLQALPPNVSAGMFSKQRAKSVNGILGMQLRLLQEQASQRTALDGEGSPIEMGFANFALGVIEPVSGIDQADLAQRAVELCSVLGPFPQDVAATIASN